MLKHAPNPIPVLQEALKYHRDEIASHEREVRRLEVAMAALSAPEATNPAKPIEIAAVAEKSPTAKITKGELVEEMVRSQGLNGVAALVIRNKAKAQGTKIAPNFPYRQLSKLVAVGKVWKDKNGLYFHSQIIPQVSAQELVTH
jgi:hypothetical protein